jgi:alpha-tubulin suppressor-like RCC1 family protein
MRDYRVRLQYFDRMGGGRGERYESCLGSGGSDDAQRMFRCRRSGRWSGRIAALGAVVLFSSLSLVPAFADGTAIITLNPTQGPVGTTVGVDSGIAGGIVLGSTEADFHSAAGLRVASVPVTGLSDSDRRGSFTVPDPLASGVYDLYLSVPLGGATAVSAGWVHTCALVSGVVHCWGRNGNGELGDASSINRGNPVKVHDGAITGGNTGVDVIDAGGFHACALKSGVVYCWGDNSRGQLGDGTTTSRSVPVAVASGAMTNTGVDAISVGAFHTCALKSGVVYCWGSNKAESGRDSGQLGDGTTTNRSVPVAVVDGAMTNTGVDAISAGDEHTCAVKAGVVYCWGSDWERQLGYGTTRMSSHGMDLYISTEPIKVAGGAMTTNTDVTAVAAGGYHTCALKSGVVYCWGDNLEGDQLGRGTSGGQSGTPVAVADGAMTNTGVEALTAGYAHTCATKPSGAYCWGSNVFGQLGDGSSTRRLSPVAVVAGAMPTSTGFTALSAGGDHTCAVRSAVVYCWGWNGLKNLGDGTATDRTSPVYVRLHRPAGSAVFTVSTAKNYGKSDKTADPKQRDRKSFSETPKK